MAARFDWENLPETAAPPAIVRNLNTAMRRLTTLLDGFTRDGGEFVVNRPLDSAFALKGFRVKSETPTSRTWEWTGVGPRVAEVWAGEKIIEQPVDESTPPWDQVEEVVEPLPEGIAEYTADFPSEGSLKYILLQAVGQNYEEGTVVQIVLHPRVSVPALDDETGEIAADALKDWAQFDLPYRPFESVADEAAKDLLVPAGEGQRVLARLEGTLWVCVGGVWVLDETTPERAYAAALYAGIVNVVHLAAEVATFVDGRAQNITDAAVVGKPNYILANGPTGPTTRTDGSPLVDLDIWLEQDKGKRPWLWTSGSWERLYTLINGGHLETGTVDANKLNVTMLSAITAILGVVTSGLLQNAASSPTAAIRLDAATALPGTATTYLDLAAAPGAPVLKTPLLQINNTTGPVSLDALKFPHTEFRPAVTGGLAQVSTTPGKTTPSAAATTVDMCLGLRLAQGLRIAGLSAYLFRQTTSDVASATLYRAMDDGTLSSLGTATHTGTGWAEVVVTPFTTETVASGTYEIWVQLNGAAANLDAALKWVKLSPEITDLKQIQSA
jgi:hypothetical protein